MKTTRDSHPQSIKRAGWLEGTNNCAHKKQNNRPKGQTSYTSRMDKYTPEQNNLTQQKVSTESKHISRRSKKKKKIKKKNSEKTT
eukprot:3583373-Ditylum_brightwellii.AAC.1